MKKDIKKRERRNKIRRRIRSTIFGSAQKPRLCVYKSNNHVYAQLVDDISSQTLTSSSTINFKSEDSTKTEQAAKVGKDIAEKAQDNGIDAVVFDRSGYKYHGLIKALAEGAREEGLEF